MRHEFDVVCLGGGVAGEAIASGLRDSGIDLVVVATDPAETAPGHIHDLEEFSRNSRRR